MGKVVGGVPTSYCTMQPFHPLLVLPQRSPGSANDRMVNEVHQVASATTKIIVKWKYYIKGAKADLKLAQAILRIRERQCHQDMAKKGKYMP